ncbi:MAG: hypothetical protein V4508_15420 [Pseudomonadota bacterium]
MNLPLLHRLEAGIAKVKVAGKEIHATHVEIQKDLNDYNNNPCKLASALIRRRHLVEFSARRRQAVALVPQGPRKASVA